MLVFKEKSGYTRHKIICTRLLHDKGKAGINELNTRNDKKIEDQIEKLLKKLTLDEKIAMIHGAGLFRTGAV